MMVRKITAVFICVALLLTIVPFAVSGETPARIPAYTGNLFMNYGNFVAEDWTGSPGFGRFTSQRWTEFGWADNYSHANSSAFHTANWTRINEFTVEPHYWWNNANASMMIYFFHRDAQNYYALRVTRSGSEHGQGYALIRVANGVQTVLQSVNTVFDTHGTTVTISAVDGNITVNAGAANLSGQALVSHGRIGFGQNNTTGVFENIRVEGEVGPPGDVRTTQVMDFESLSTMPNYDRLELASNWDVYGETLAAIVVNDPLDQRGQVGYFTNLGGGTGTRSQWNFNRVTGLTSFEFWWRISGLEDGNNNIYFNLRNENTTFATLHVREHDGNRVLQMYNNMPILNPGADNVWDRPLWGSVQTSWVKVSMDINFADGYVTNVAINDDIRMIAGQPARYGFSSPVTGFNNFEIDTISAGFTWTTPAHARIWVDNIAVTGVEDDDGGNNGGNGYDVPRPVTFNLSSPPAPLADWIPEENRPSYRVEDWGGFVMIGNQESYLLYDRYIFSQLDNFDITIGRWNPAENWVAGPWLYVFFLAQDRDNTYAVRSNRSNGVVQLIRRVDGVTSVLSTANGINQADLRMVISANEDEITVSLHERYYTPSLATLAHTIVAADEPLISVGGRIGFGRSADTPYGAFQRIQGSGIATIAQPPPPPPPPASGYVGADRQVIIEGQADAVFANRTVTLTMVDASVTDIENVTDAQISHVAQAVIAYDGTYEFTFMYDGFTFTNNVVNNRRVYLSVDGTDVTPTITRSEVVPVVLVLNVTVNEAVATLILNADATAPLPLGDHMLILAFYAGDYLERVYTRPINITGTDEFTLSRPVESGETRVRAFAWGSRATIEPLVIFEFEDIPLP